MEDTALKAALRNLLNQGNKAEDSKLMKMAAAKNQPKPDVCPECTKAMVDGKCEECGYEAAVSEDSGEDGMASLLEQGASEG